MPDLTNREREVLCLLALSNAQIATQLAISSQTLKAHLTHIRIKLGTPSKAACLVRALRLGLVRLEEVQG